MKHIKTFDTFLFEKKIVINEYINLDFLGLVKKEIKRFNTTTKSLTLFDFKENIVLAHIEYDNSNSKDAFDIHRSYAQKDWGANIYDFALMETYPLPIVPSKIIVPKAINIWKYYYDLRSDVKKVPIMSDSENYSDTYRNFLDDKPKSDDNLKYLSCYYFMEKTEEYENLLKKGSILSVEYGIKPSFITELGYKAFKNVYDY